MSAHCHFQEDTMHNLRQIQRQMRLLDTRLHLLRERLCACRLHRPCFHRCCLHLPDCHCHCLGRRALAARLDMERRLNRMRRLGMMLSSARSQSHLALVDVKCSDPSDVSVIVKDGKVTVSADDEVTYSVESNSLTKIETVPKCCPHLCDF